MQKFSTKELAKQIKQHIKEMVHHDQVGTILGMSVFNMKSVDTIHHVNRIQNGGNHMTISIDAESI